MRILIIVLLGFQSSFAQIIPSVSVDSSQLLDNSNPDFKKDIAAYDQYINFTSSNYWGTVRVNYVIAMKDNSWNGFVFTTRHKRKNHEIKKLQKTKRKAVQLDTTELAAFFLYAETNDFWKLNCDSLNLRTTANGNGTTVLHSISDGISYQFEVSNGAIIYQLASYAPKHFQTIIFIKQRETFLKSKDLFYALFD